MWKRISIAGMSALLVGATFTSMVPAVAGASDGTTACRGRLHSGTYEKVVVPKGAVCLSKGPIEIREGLWIRAGATFVLGSEESGWTTGTIGDGVHADHAASVQIHFATIYGGIDIRGGSGPFGGPFDVTWNTIEDSYVHGGVAIVGYDGFWMGFIRNHTGQGAVKLRNNVLADPDGNEYVTNHIHGNLRCSGNSPAPQVGDSGGLRNHVSGRKVGQCADL
ncbi:MAG: hypothetical protein QOE83_2699 [Actinomycetota bacterium]|jgi:hypothetical protein|nr:hypothetical protein [Actinomycetota bacterium]